MGDNLYVVQYSDFDLNICSHHDNNDYYLLTTNHSETVFHSIFKSVEYYQIDDKFINFFLENPFDGSWNDLDLEALGFEAHEIE